MSRMKNAGAIATIVAVAVTIGLCVSISESGVSRKHSSRLLESGLVEVPNDVKAVQFVDGETGDPETPEVVLIDDDGARGASINYDRTTRVYLVPKHAKKIEATQGTKSRVYSLEGTVAVKFVGP